MKKVEVKALMKAHDIDGTGFIEYEDFVEISTSCYFYVQTRDSF